MKRRPHTPEELQRLRRQAEDFVRAGPQQVSSLSKENVQSLVQELQVYQVELEMQNEQLNTVNLELEAARNKYINLYEFAPVGYLTLDAGGKIRDANLTVARLLGVERRSLIERFLDQYVVPSDQRALSAHLDHVLAERRKQTCEVQMLKEDGARFYAGIETIVGYEAQGPGPHYWMVLMDLTGQRQMEQELQHLNAELTKRVQAYEAVVRELEASRNDLQDKNNALEQFQDAVVGRELKMMKLEKEMERLKQESTKSKAEQESAD